MILVDANLLIYAYHSASPYHERARGWLEAVFESQEPIGFAWTTLHAFLRITTNPKILGDPLSIAEAAAIVEEFLERPQATVLEPGPRYWPILRRVLEEARVQGPLVSDAHLVALAIEHGAKLCSSDRDFRRFPGIELFDPLVADS
jgi:hypothetical protein